VTARVAIPAVLALAMAASITLAERPPEQREDAALVVVGTIKKITSKNKTFVGDGIQTSYKAAVVVDEVDRGKGVKVGDKITVNWFQVTKPPSRPVGGAFGHGYPIKAKDKARFWLMGTPEKGWTIIYNSNGVEKLKK
jgi:hypothetical protein